MYKKIGLLVILFFVIGFFSTELFAQGCSMCKATAESNILEGGEEASGLNAGILYILVFPYILFSAFVYYWRNHRKELKKENIEYQS
jgi:hypothetical protein